MAKLGYCGERHDTRTRVGTSAARTSHAAGSRGERPGHSPLEIELLRAIVEAGEIRASDLANRLFVTKTSISRYVNDMLDEGLLSQRRDPSDGRATLLSVSAAGQREFEEREARRSALLREICQDGPRGTWRN